MSEDYIAKQVREFHSPNGDFWYRNNALYRIATDAELFTPRDYNFYDQNKGWLTPEQRYRILNWLVCDAQMEIEGHLTLHIFGEERLKAWHKEAKERYPDTELVLLFEDQGETELEFTFYFQPQPNCPDDIREHDFPLRHHIWEYGSAFFNRDGTTWFEDFCECYPDQGSWAIPNTRMAKYRIPAFGLNPDHLEYNHRTVAELLGTPNPYTRFRRWIDSSLRQEGEPILIEEVPDLYPQLVEPAKTLGWELEWRETSENYILRAGWSAIHVHGWNDDGEEWSLILYVPTHQLNAA